jgi:CubicO group peptidase (beta-lactamase class C family)
MATLADGQQYLGAFGRRHAEKPAPMTTDTVFWIASFTKLVTSVVALQLVEEGVISLDQPVASVRPDFAELGILDGFDAAGAPRVRQARDTPTIRHLLTHTSGLGYAFMDVDLARYAELKHMPPGSGHLLPRRFEAGARWQYGASTDWLGVVIEGVCGQGLDAVFQRRIFDRLGMTDTTFVPDAAQKARSAAMHARLPDGDAAPIDFALAPPPNPNLGGGGLYSTAPDFMRLLRALLDGTILGDWSRAALFENQVGDLEAGVLASSMPSFTNPYDPIPGCPKRWSLGMLINPQAGPAGRAAGSAAWAGLANCYYWMDPSRGLAGVLMAQVLPFADRKVLGLFSAFERAVYA